jgi:hypothetical protein
MTVNECTEMINKVAKDQNSENFIIYDGVAYPENYYKSNIRIMWILKEAYETNGRYGWQVGKIYKQNQPIKSRTLKRMAYISYAIIKNCHLQDVFKAKNTDLIESIKSIAYINLNKIAAKKRSPIDMSPLYNIWRDVLLKQIEIYDPNIIICGNTLQYFLKDIDFSKGIKKTIGMKNRNYFLYQNKIYINVYHPAYTFSKKDYVSKIVEAVNDWRNLNGK